MRLVRTLPVPTDDTQHMFNPHGLSVDEANNIMLTSDYVCPVSTLHVGGGVPHLDGSIRVWDLASDLSPARLSWAISPERWTSN